MFQITPHWWFLSHPPCPSHMSWLSVPFPGMDPSPWLCCSTLDEVDDKRSPSVVGSTLQSVGAQNIAGEPSLPQLGLPLWPVTSLSLKAKALPPFQLQFRPLSLLLSHCSFLAPCMPALSCVMLSFAMDFFPAHLVSALTAYHLWGLTY